MVLGLSSQDVSGFKLLACLLLLFTLMSSVVYDVLHLNSITPLGLNAPPNSFSEARALEHVRVLTKQIDGRQEGRPGLREAARYIEGQLEMIKGRAGSNLKIEIEEMVINGSFNMLFLGHSISLGYRNHTNIVMRISSVESHDTDPSVLVNGHYDSPLGSPGAGDCGSCIATMLELARLTVDSDWVPPRPIIFLFNGAEELFLLGAHGFMQNNKWRDSIGAAINMEASGTGGMDLVCQSGPGSWPSRIYAQSAIYPMAHSLAQDVFPVIPGDTDYRIFSQDYGDIPGLDIIFLFGGYFYHTSYDTMERLLPGSIQARGDNLFSVIKAFTNSSELQSSYDRAARKANLEKDERAVFFDYLSWFMVFYSRTVALVLHSIPLFIFLGMPFYMWLQGSRASSWPLIYFDYIKGFLFHAFGIMLAIVFPIMVSIINLKFSSHAMAWFANPQLACAMFIPSSLVGLLIPSIIWRSFSLSQNVPVLKTSKEALCDEARFWGAFGFYAILTMAYLLAGLSGGFLTFFASASMITAWICYSIAIKYCRKSLGLTAFYVIPLIPLMAYSVYFGGFLAQFIIEKMGMMGAIPPPYGYFVPDVVVAAIFGVVTGWCIGPLIPVCGQWLARPSILKLLLHITLIALALSTQFFPYSMDAPKRVVFQHTLRTEGSNQILESKYDFTVVDSNSLNFLFKHSPEVTRKLNISSDSLEAVEFSGRDTWLALFPVSSLVSRSMRFPAESNHISKQTTSFPRVFIRQPQTVSEEGSRGVYLELSLGSVEEIWVTVINVTGPLSNWSFSDNTLPAPETTDGGPPSYICRLSGVDDNENWTFWLEASSSEDLRVNVAVLGQRVSDEAKEVKRLFPDWVDVVAYASFMSTFIT